MNSSTSRRTTLITGASRGLGAAIALEQGAVGSNVAINYFNSSDAADTVLPAHSAGRRLRPCIQGRRA